MNIGIISEGVVENHSKYGKALNQCFLIKDLIQKLNARNILKRIKHLSILHSAIKYLSNGKE